jgi:hypothetical protein
MDPASAEKVGQFLIDLAARHSELGPSQVSALTKAFSALGLAPAGVYSLIHERTMHAAGDLVTVRPAGERVQGEAIPPPPATESDQAVGEPAHVVLDPTVIEARRRDTARAAALLGEVFADEETEVVPQAEELSSVNATLLRQLSARPTWTRQEFDSLAESLGVLPNGALESLNDAAFETCGESVIEGDDVLEINNDVLQELL